MAAMTEQVHRDKGDEDHHPEPVCCEPFHGRVLPVVADGRCLLSAPSSGHRMKRSHVP
jgi:hypothetical protein